MSKIPNTPHTGDDIPVLHLPPVSLEMLNAYAAASGDHAAVHLDTENARSMGFSDVIAHGLLVMAFMGRAVTDRFALQNLLSLSARFTDVVNLGDALTCHGKITEIRADSTCALDLSVQNQHGQVKIKGQAVVRF